MNPYRRPSARSFTSAINFQPGTAIRSLLSASLAAGTGQRAIVRDAIRGISHHGTATRRVCQCRYPDTAFSAFSSRCVDGKNGGDASAAGESCPSFSWNRAC